MINVRFDIDRAQARFASLGFTITPRGHHTLGSVNHLLVFATDYLELLGVPRERAGARPEIARAPLGPSGLVFQCTDADAVHAHLEAIGMAGDPPQAFSRPLALPGGTRDVRFRTVTVRPGVFPAGRIYFCEHATPDLVWRREWQGHPNRSCGIAEVVVACAEPEREAARYRRLLDAAVSGRGGDEAAVDLGRARLTLLSPARYRDRFGHLASDTEGRASMFGAIGIRTESRDAVAARFEGLPDPISFEVEPARVAVRVPELDTVLEFVD